ncbi:hypothetical protein D3C78_771010 [compost metagenome]
MHDRCTYLNARSAHQHEFNNILPGRNPSNTGDRNAYSPVTSTLSYHAKRNRLHSWTTVTSMRTLTSNVRNRIPAMNIYTSKTIDRIDHTNRVRSTLNRMAGNDGDIRNIRRQLHNHRGRSYFFYPGGLCLHQIRLLPRSSAHSTLSHSVRTAKVKLQTVYTHILYPLNNLMPFMLRWFYHQGGYNRMIRKSFLRFINFLQINFKRTVGDQFNIVKARNPLPIEIYCRKPR